MFKAIQDGDIALLDSILDAYPEALETFGEHNSLVRDKTPLMFSMQCSNFELANHLLDRGANAAATMAGGPKSPAISLCMQFAYCDKRGHDRWIELAIRLLDNGADPNTGLWPALHSYGGIVDRDDLIRLCLERGANPDIKLGNSGNTVRELVEINKRLYSDGILKIFEVSS